MNKGVLRQVVVLLSVLATIGVNTAATLLPLNDLTTGELADRFDVFFVPASYVFSIWSVIYLLFLVYAVWQLLPAQRTPIRTESGSSISSRSRTTPTCRVSSQRRRASTSAWVIRSSSSSR